MGNVYFNRAVLKTLSAASKPRKDNLTAERYKFNCINCRRSISINILKKNSIKVHFKNTKQKVLMKESRKMSTGEETYILHNFIS